MSSVRFPDVGYSPDNYAYLVELTELDNISFYQEFGIPEQTFYAHLSGKRSMSWEKWCVLYESVFECLLGVHDQ